MAEDARRNGCAVPRRLGCEASDCVLLAVVAAQPVPARVGVPAKLGVQVAPSAPSACVHADEVGAAAGPNRVGPALSMRVGPRGCCVAGARRPRLRGWLGGGRAVRALSACREAGAARSSSSPAARSHLSSPPACCSGLCCRRRARRPASKRARRPASKGAVLRAVAAGDRCGSLRRRWRAGRPARKWWGFAARSGGLDGWLAQGEVRKGSRDGGCQVLLLLRVQSRRAPQCAAGRGVASELSLPRSRRRGQAAQVRRGYRRK